MNARGELAVLDYDDFEFDYFLELAEVDHVFRCGLGKTDKSTGQEGREKGD